MRSLEEIQHQNRHLAIVRHGQAVYRELINFVGKAKAANWPEAHYRAAEALIKDIEKSATGRELTDGVPAGYEAA